MNDEYWNQIYDDLKFWSNCFALKKNDDLIPIRYFSYEAFYTYFAYQQRQKITKKALSAQLKTNPHPMDKYRVNCPLARMELFRNIYNIKKGDKIFLSPFC